MSAVSYSRRRVPCHGCISAKVLLVNEAPGPEEDAALIPLVRKQGGNLYRALCNAGVRWALNVPTFRWPNTTTGEASRSVECSLNKKHEFLDIRAKYITCTNAYDRLPRPTDGSARFCAPVPRDVCSQKNLSRLSEEIHPQHSVVLLCGVSAYLAGTGKVLVAPSKREHTALYACELGALNNRLKACFRYGWYMGHTRRWSLKTQACNRALREVASTVGGRLEMRRLSPHLKYPAAKFAKFWHGAQGCLRIQIPSSLITILILE